MGKRNGPAHGTSAGRSTFWISETSNDDFRRLKMGEYRGLKIAAAESWGWYP